MEFPSISQIIRRHQRPVAVQSYAEDDPRSQIVKLLEEGAAQKVISQFSDDDPRCLNGLTWAYLLDDQLDEAEQQAEKAVATHSAALAAALANQAAVIIHRGGDTHVILALLQRAIDVDPLSHSAHANRISYASRIHDEVMLETFIESMIDLVPDWNSNPEYREMLVSDHDLTWARTQPCFSIVFSKLKESSS